MDALGALAESAGMENTTGPWTEYQSAAPKAEKGPWDDYEPEKPEEPGLLRGAGDSAVALGTGVIQGVRMLSDIAGADNAVSRKLGDAAQSVDDLTSPFRKAERQERARKIREAEESGSTWEEVKANVGAFTEAPLDTTLNALGTSAPTIGTAMLTGGASLPAQIAARAAPALMGAAQGVGAIKGSVFEAVKQKHMDAGLSEADAEQRASQAQAYDGDNLGSIALGGVMGAVAGSTGAEKALGRVVGNKIANNAANAGVMKSAAIGVAKEAPMEALQGGQERVASNLALQGEGFDTPTFQGAVGQAALEGLASAPIGGGFGAMEAMSARRQDAAPTEQAGPAADTIAPDQPSEQGLLALPAPQINVSPDGAAETTVDRNDRLQRIQSGDIVDVTPIVKRSEQMGLNPAAGPMSAAAATAVDTGAHDQAQQQTAMAQAAEVAAQEAKKPAKKYAHRVNGTLDGKPFQTMVMAASTDEAMVAAVKASPGLQPASAEPVSKSVATQPATPGEPTNGTTPAQAVTKEPGRQTEKQDALSSGVVLHPSGAEVVGAKSLGNSSSADSKRFSDLAGSEALLKKWLDGIDAEADASVKRHMLRVSQDQKIFNSVVELIPVDVMNMLGRLKLTPEMIFNNPSVLKSNGVRGNGDNSVAIPIDAAAAIMRAVALGAAENLSVDKLPHSGGLSVRGGATNDAFVPSAIDVVGGLPGHGGGLVRGAAGPAAKNVGGSDDLGLVPSDKQAALDARNSKHSGNPVAGLNGNVSEAVEAAPQEQAQPAPANLNPPRGILAKKAEADAARAASTTNVQDAPQQPAGTEAQATTGEARAPEGGNATASEGVPAAPGAGDVQTDGVKRSKNGYAEVRLNGKKHVVTPYDDYFVIRDADGLLVRDEENKTLKFKSEPDAIQHAERNAKPKTESDAIAEAAHQAATSPKNDLPQPTEAQKEAGNYVKGHVTINGHGISIENPAGSKRRPEWPSLKNHYGYFKGSVGADKDHVDLFMTDRAGDASLPVFVVDQTNRDGTFDEHKIIMGAADEAEARATYLQNYEKGWTGLGAITQMSQDEFKAWVRDPAKTKKPVALKRGVLAKMADQKAKAARRKSEDIRDIRWESMNLSERERVVEAIGRKGIFAQKLAEKRWDRIDAEVKAKLREVLDAQQPAKPQPEPAAKAPPAGPVKPDPAPQPKAEKPQDAPAEKKPPEKIEDFGEKLAGARKDYAATLKDAMSVDVAAEPLSKSWPEPDYQKLLDGGADPFMVAWVHAARDEIPTKPQTSWKLSGWVKSVDMLRKVSSQMLSGEVTKERLQEMLEKPEYGNLKRQLGGRAELYQAVGHGKSLKGITFMEHHYSMYRDEKNVTKWTVEMKAKSSSFGGWPREIAVADTKADALAQFKAKYEGLDAGPKGKGSASFVIYRKRGETGAFIGKKIGREYIDLHKAEDVKAARAYLADNTDKLEKALERYKDTPYERGEENAPRVGDDHRNGAPVTPEVFGQTFGFRGVQFGNYVEQGRRQSDLNEAFDALMDMAAVLGIPPKAISLNGRLGLAFGARGKGGKNAPAAHYEAGNVVINLTKGGGPGSLAHEWFHAMDNYFAKQGGGAGYMTDGADGAALREEMRQAFKAVKTAVNTGALKLRSLELDKRRTKPYWSTPIEMAARSFESYVVAKLQDQNASNDYLANVVNDKVWEISEAARAEFFTGKQASPSYPYPTVDELPVLRAAFDDFFKVVQTRETEDGNTEMFYGTKDKAQGTPTDRAVMAMAGEGKSADEILRFIANASKSPFNRQIANLLRRTKANPAVSIGGDMGGGAGFKFLAKYSRKNHEVTLSEGASGKAEQIFLHETVHAATLLALDRGGEHAARMKALYESVKAQGLTDAYGMKNVGEFVAEAFTNPEFQKLLKGFKAPGGTAWDRFVAAVRRILGLSDQSQDALSAALELGVEVMRENVPLRKARSFSAEDAPEYFGMADAASLKQSALDQIHQTLSHPGKVSVWDKTIGTMRNLAERAPAFKPVFEAAQRFLDDVSLLANEAADVAPRLLPRVESWRDLTKKPVSADDNKAISKPIFEGTLMWGRDTDGKPVLVDDMAKKYADLSTEKRAKMLMAAGRLDDRVLRMWQGLPSDQFDSLVNSRFESQMLKAGVVWKDAELKSLFNLSDNQISLYREARQAIDRSIDLTARADMLRAVGTGYAGMRDAVLELPTLADARDLLVETLHADALDNADQADRLMGMVNTIADRFEKATELSASGYAPLSRFGRYTLDVVDASGERQYFGMYESMRDANLAKIQMAGAFPGAAITQGTMSAEAYKLFSGITPESLELFGNMLGLDAEGGDARDKAFQEYLKLSKNNHSALKRLMHRKGIAGYSEDVGRVLASFVYSNARQAAGGLNAGTIEEAVNAIPKDQGELKDVAMGLRDYVRDPQEEGQAIRGMLFAQYLGGSLASAFVNTTQPFAVTLPWLSQFGGMKVAGRHLAKALKDMAGKGAYEADLKTALDRAEEDGVVSPQEIHQLMAQARGAGGLRSGDGTRAGNARAAASNAWERTKVAWGQPFALAEQFNRRSTFIAAYRLAKERGMQSPAEFARRAVLETQFLYSKANKPRWARGAVGGTLFTFKTYSVSYLELLNRMWTQGGPEGKRAVGWAMVMLMLMGGAGGLPFLEDLEDLIDGIAQMMGYNLSAKRWRQEAIAQIVGKELGEFVNSGLSGLPGAPIDVSGRLGMGDLIPGTGLLMTKQSRERDLMEIVGPAGDLVSRGFKGARKALSGDIGGAALELSPTAVRNAAKGIDMAASGMYKDTKGYKVMDTTLAEAAAKLVGFQPRSVAKDSEATGFKMRTKSYYIQQSSEIKAQWADALFRKDEGALQDVRERLADWNRKNPDLPIVVKMPNVWKRVREMGKDRGQRIADTAPKALRQEMRELARDN